MNTKLALDLSFELMSIYLVHLFIKMTNVYYQLRYKILLEIFKYVFLNFKIRIEITTIFVMCSLFTLFLTMSPRSAQWFLSL